MANERANPLDFSDMDFSDFKPAATRSRPAVKEDEIAEIAAVNHFTSRESAPRKKQEAVSAAPATVAPATIRDRAPRRKGRPPTGRNVQFNAKVTLDTNDKAYEMLERLSEAQGRTVTMGEMLESAYAALERELNAKKRN